MDKRIVVQQFDAKAEVFTQRLGYEKVISGTGKEWAVFIHGMGGNRNGFKRQLDAYSERYNLLLIDLHGHGLSKDLALWKAKDKGEAVTFENIAHSVLKVLDHEGIKQAHFVGLSLGTLILRALVEIAPERFFSMVLAGAAIKCGVMAKSLFIVGNMVRSMTPYMLLYAGFAWIMMPRKNHKKSRDIFIQEAQKLGGQEFFAWYELIQTFDTKYPPEHLNTISVPTLYVMGSQDHMFTGLVQKYAAGVVGADIHIIEKCGHCSCIEAAEEFNAVSLKFLAQLNKEGISA